MSEWYLKGINTLGIHYSKTSVILTIDGVKMIFAWSYSKNKLVYQRDNYTRKR